MLSNALDIFNRTVLETFLLSIGWSNELRSFRQRVSSSTTSALILRSIRQRLMSVDGLAYKRTCKSRVLNFSNRIGHRSIGLTDFVRLYFSFSALFLFLRNSKLTENSESLIFDGL